MCEKIWGASASQISIDMPQTFSVGAFLESLRLRQGRSLELLQNICTDLDSDRTWAEMVLCTMNHCVVDLEAQGLENFPEWHKKLNVALEQVRCQEAPVKDVQVAL